MIPTINDILTHEYPMSLDYDFDGSCPCFHIDGDGFRVDGHCWRTSRCCRWSGIHVTGVDHDTAMRIGIHIATHNGWSGLGFQDSNPQKIINMGNFTRVADGHTDWDIRSTLEKE